MRMKNCLCKEDQARLVIQMDYIKEFVETEGDEYKVDLESWILRKTLSAELKSLGVINTKEFEITMSKDVNEFKIFRVAKRQKKESPKTS